MYYKRGDGGAPSGRKTCIGGTAFAARWESCTGVWGVFATFEEMNNLLSTQQSHILLAWYFDW